jgi:hypothetical protein
VAVFSGALLSSGNGANLVVHGGIHQCRGRCVTPSTGNTLDIHSYTLSEMYWFNFDSAEWTRYNLTVQPSKAFHALHSHREVNGRRMLFTFGGWGHSTTNTQQGEYQMQGESRMQGDLWQLAVDGLTLSSAWEKLIPASNALPAPRMASGGGYLSGGAPRFVVAGGLTCANASVNELHTCSTVLEDLWSFDLWGWIAGEYEPSPPLLPLFIPLCIIQFIPCTLCLTGCCPAQGDCDNQEHSRRAAIRPRLPHTAGGRVGGRRAQSRLHCQLSRG